MDTFTTFLKALQRDGNAELLDIVEKGYQIISESAFYGTQNARVVKDTPAGDVQGVPAPADMCTEEATAAEKPEKKKKIKNIS